MHRGGWKAGMGPIGPLLKAQLAMLTWAACPFPPACLPPRSQALPFPAPPSRPGELASRQCRRAIWDCASIPARLALGLCGVVSVHVSASHSGSTHAARHGTVYSTWAANMRHSVNHARTAHHETRSGGLVLPAFKGEVALGRLTGEVSRHCT